MLKRILALVLVAAAACFTLTLQAEDKEEKYEAKCPVSGKPIVETVSVDYKDAKVYFCCPGCPDAFKKDTAKYAAKANQQLVGTKQAVEVKCPVAGRPLNPATAIDVQGVKVSFCCNNCKGKVAKASGDEQLALVFGEEAFKKGFEVKKEKEEK
jgi:YHS domain-containing protein